MCIAGPCAWIVLTAMTALGVLRYLRFPSCLRAREDRGQIRVRVVGTEDEADCVSFGTTKHLSSSSVGPGLLVAPGSA